MEAVTLASELIAIDTSNYGDPDRPGTERPAAEYVAEKLTEVGYDITYVETGPRRGNVVARLPGAGSSNALLVHGHLDVVPADPGEWSVHPFSGEIRDGYVWGRGAVDMKGMVAMTLAVARRFKRDGVVPPRDLIFAFVADEEAGGQLGAARLVAEHRELFDGATEAISEVGGFSVPLGGERAYLVQVAEKSAVLLRLTARGSAGHGAMLHDDNAIARLAAAVDRLDRHRFPLTLTDPVRRFLAGAADALGADDEPDALVARLGPLSRLIGASLRDTANVTGFQAGYRSNVVPSVATATVDCRVLPGREEAFRRETEALLGPAIEADWRSLAGVSTSFDGELPAAMAAAIAAEDPGARLLPYLLPAGTDAKSFARLGVRNFGFAPLRLPAELDFTSLFHGVDERVPVTALEFGTRVLDRLLSGSASR
jgi:acetylornithine deacetylase/succinyl-diaminopimelate desuccinylase-like protein